MWGVDLLVATDLTGRQHVALAIVEHASRACLRLQRLEDKSSVRRLQQIAQVVRRYGRPRFVRTDNEAVFTSRRLRWGLRLLGIRHQRTEPGSPWQNGRVERFIGTVKRLLAPHIVENVAQLDRAFRQVRTRYNHLRPHQHLRGKTPAEVWAGIDVFAQSHRVPAWLTDWWSRHDDG